MHYFFLRALHWRCKLSILHTNFLHMPFNKRITAKMTHTHTKKKWFSSLLTIKNSRCEQTRLLSMVCTLMPIYHACTNKYLFFFFQKGEHGKKRWWQQTHLSGNLFDVSFRKLKILCNKPISYEVLWKPYSCSISMFLFIPFFRIASYCDYRQSILQPK